MNDPRFLSDLEEVTVFHSVLTKDRQLPHLAGQGERRTTKYCPRSVDAMEMGARSKSKGREIANEVFFSATHTFVLAPCFQIATQGKAAGASESNLGSFCQVKLRWVLSKDCERNKRPGALALAFLQMKGLNAFAKKAPTGAAETSKTKLHNQRLMSLGRGGREIFGVMLMSAD